MASTAAAAKETKKCDKNKKKINLRSEIDLLVVTASILILD